MAKEIIKQETVFIWLVLCVAFGLPLMLIDSLIVWLLHDCWPMGTAMTSNCFALVPGFEWHLVGVFAPAFVGGTITAWWLNRRKQREQHGS